MFFYICFYFLTHKQTFKSAFRENTDPTYSCDKPAVLPLCW
jgi:hypothetical protein